MRSRLICAVFAGLTLLGAEQARACSCVGPAKGQSIEDFYEETAKRSDAVVTARLIRVEGADATPPDLQPASFFFRIERAYKKRNRLQPGDRLRVRALIDSGANCGLPDARGFRTGMFLYRSKAGWTTSACSLAAPGILKDALGRATARAGTFRPSSPAPAPARREAQCRGPASP